MARFNKGVWSPRAPNPNSVGLGSWSGDEGDNVHLFISSHFYYFYFSVVGPLNGTVPNSGME